MQVLGLAEIRLAEDFLSDGGIGMEFKNLKIHEIRAICVKSTDLAVIWLNKILVWRISGENGHNLVKSTGDAAIGMNKFFSGEFCVFRGKWSFVSLGVAMEVSLVM